MSKQAAILTRVSTGNQSVQMQIDECKTWCEAKGIKVYKVYKEVISGSTTNDKREVLQKLIKDAKAGKFTHLVVYRLDRLGRSVKDVLEVVDILCEKQGVALVSLHEALDTSSSLGKFVLTVLSALNQLSREMTIARVKSGIAAHRKRNGGRWGRKPVQFDTALALRMRDEGHSFKSIATAVGVSVGTVHGYFKNVQNSPISKSMQIVTGAYQNTPSTIIHHTLVI